MRSNTAHASLMPPLLAACLTLGLFASARAARAGTSGAGNPNLITSADLQELEQAGVRDLYEVVRRLRPHWLEVRTQRSLRLETIILVYHDNTRLGDISTLRGYPLMNVNSIRYLDAAQANLLPGAAGSAHVEGAIVISTAIPQDRRR